MLFLGHPGLFVVFLSFRQQALFSGSLMILRADMTVCRYFYAQTPAEEAFWKKKNCKNLYNIFIEASSNN